MFLLHSLWLCFAFLAIEGANVTSSPALHSISSIKQNTQIENGPDKVVIFSDSAVADANSRSSPKNESNASDVLQTSPETKHLRFVTNTSGFPDPPPSSGNVSAPTIAPINKASSPAISATPTKAARNLTNSAPNSTATPTKASTTKTTKTTITTTLTPKKPKITFSVEDQPDLLAKVHGANPPMVASNTTSNGGNSSGQIAVIASPSVPISLQPSDTISLSSHRDGRAFIVPMVAIIFIIPLLVILAHFVTRQFRDYWSKRKYRRMDYLIEEMYH